MDLAERGECKDLSPTSSRHMEMATRPLGTSANLRLNEWSRYRGSFPVSSGVMRPMVANVLTRPCLISDSRGQIEDACRALHRHMQSQSVHPGKHANNRHHRRNVDLPTPRPNVFCSGSAGSAQVSSGGLKPKLPEASPRVDIAWTMQKVAYSSS